jgi:hypothetical protein
MPAQLHRAGIHRGQPGLVAGEQVPVCGWVRRVGAAGSHQVCRLARLHRRRPRPGDTVFAVHHEVDGELSTVGICVTDGVGAYDGSVRLGQFVEAVEGERMGQRVDVDVVANDDDLDIGVGEVIGRERVETAAAQHDPDHVWGQLLAADHLERVDRTSCHAHLLGSLATSPTIRAVTVRWPATVLGPLPPGEFPLAVRAYHESGQLQGGQRTQDLRGR